MVIDKLSNFEKYVELHPRFGKVLEYLNKTDLNKVDFGDYKIDGEKVYVRILNPKPAIEKKYKLEVHKKYIDIQYSFKESFDIGWKSTSDCKNIDKAYDEQKDVLLFSDAYESKVKLSQGLFTILFPEDAHGPMPPDSDSKRVVFKVLI
jgi:YhcH/YjgK/YiaL family protein